jgi:hypothetical protein
MRWFTRWYGANPLHLLTLVGCLALAGYAAEKLPPRHAIAILEWLVGAVIGHDLILMPLYTVADRSVLAVFRHRQPHLPTVPWINYLRVPVALSGMLLLIWFPLIFRLPTRFTLLTSLPLDPYLWHWLAVTGALFLLSALALALRLGTSRDRPEAAGRDGEPAVLPRRVAPGYPDGPHYPEGPYYPEEPRYPQGPRYPEEPRYPQGPRYPEEPRYPQGPYYPEEPRYPQAPRYPEAPRYPGRAGNPRGPRHARNEPDSAPW